MRSLSAIPTSVRGWTLDVLNVLRRLGRHDFSLKEVYGFENELQAAHPGNRNVRPKIRQQLQVLRDAGLLSFTGAGRYSLRA
jgi:type II restriction enzyme